MHDLSLITVMDYYFIGQTEHQATPKNSKSVFESDMLSINQLNLSHNKYEDHRPLMVSVTGVCQF